MYPVCDFQLDPQFTIIFHHGGHKLKSFIKENSLYARFWQPHPEPT